MFGSKLFRFFLSLFCFCPLLSNVVPRWMLSHATVGFHNIFLGFGLLGALDLIREQLEEVCERTPRLAFQYAGDISK